METNKILVNFDFINVKVKPEINPTYFQTTDYNILKNIFPVSYEKQLKIGDAIIIESKKMKIIDIQIKVFPEMNTKNLVKNYVNNEKEIGVAFDYNTKIIIYFEEVKD